MEKKLKIIIAATLILASSAAAYFLSQNKKESPKVEPAVVEPTIKIDRTSADEEKERKYREEVRKANQRDKEHLRSIGVKID